MDFLNLIYENNLILIPFFMIIGWVIKITGLIPNKMIPLILLFLGIIITPIFNLATGYSTELLIKSIIQGGLVAGASVGLHQTAKQLNRKGE